MKRLSISIFLMTVFFMLFSSSTLGQLKTTTIAPVETLITPIAGNFAVPPKKYDPNGYRHDYLISLVKQNLYLKISSGDVVVTLVRAGQSTVIPGVKEKGGYLKYVLPAGEYRIVVKPGLRAFITEKPRRTAPGVYGPPAAQKKLIDYKLLIRTTQWDIYNK